MNNSQLLTDIFEFDSPITQDHVIVPAQIVGQLAIHPVPLFDGRISESYTLSHVESACYVWDFAEWVPLIEIRRLAEMLTVEDFDTYAAGGFQDKAFVARCKAIYAEWDATIPDRLAHDRTEAV